MPELLGKVKEKIVLRFKVTTFSLVTYISWGCTSHRLHLYTLTHLYYMLQLKNRSLLTLGRCLTHPTSLSIPYYCIRRAVEVAPEAVHTVSNLEVYSHRRGCCIWCAGSDNRLNFLTATSHCLGAQSTNPSFAVDLYKLLGVCLQARFGPYPLTYKPITFAPTLQKYFR